MMFVAYTVVVVCRKLVGELKDCCSNNGGLEKKKKNCFQTQTVLLQLAKQCATPAIYSCYQHASLGEAT